jgi:hypothetical protein
MTTNEELPPTNENPCKLRCNNCERVIRGEIITVAGLEYCDGCEPKQCEDCGNDWQEVTDILILTNL